MIVTLPKIKTRVAIIHNIPKLFFRNIENSKSFDDHLFPVWAKTVFAHTTLKTKFKAVYDKYKAISNKTDRNLIVNAFINTNKVTDLCNNNPTALMIQLYELHPSIRAEISTVFFYLYNTAINHLPFKLYVNDNVNNVINGFTISNQILVCPFCGIESFTNLQGQARIPFDHWLHKSTFPMAAVNFNNLVPIGKDCNARPAKGDKNILINSKTNARVIAYYPYLKHSGISNAFKFIIEPSINSINDTDWEFTCAPVDTTEKDIFDSWTTTMNIKLRYNDYFRKVIFTMWQTEYKAFIDNPDSGLSHATTNDDLRANFKKWRATYNIKARPGSILYISFINYLINHASEKYIFGLRENFKRT